MSQDDQTRINKIFKLILSFVSDIEECFGLQHSLKLYNRLLTKNVNTDQEREEHVTIFAKYVSDNQDAILTKDPKKLKEEGVIFFSKKINIKLGEIFKKADSDQAEAIWRHLLVISTAVDPSSDAMNVLKKSMESKSNEGNLLFNIMDKIQSNVNPDVNDPMSAIMGLMSSGVMTELMSSMSSGMSNGQLDITKLFGLVQGMIGQFAPQAATSGAPTEETEVKEETEEPLVEEVESLSIKDKTD